MIKAWYNTIAAQLAGMVEISDDEITRHSNGEITKATEYDENEPATGKITDPEIFGELSKDGMGKISTEDMDKMGHITLPIPVVNIQYTRGRKPVLAKELGMSLKELEDIVYGQVYIPEDADVSQAISVKEYLNDPSNSQNGYLTGGEAIEKLMKRNQVPDVIQKAAVIHHIPVMPICMRYFWSEPEGKYLESSLNHLYESLLTRIGRYKRLLSLNCPEVILTNERRQLQDGVDRLVNNGAHSFAAVNSYNCLPDDSLEDLFEAVTEAQRNKAKKRKDVTNISSFLSKAEELRQYNLSLSNESYDVDSPEIQKLDMMEEELKQQFHPFVEEYMKENYKMYAEFMDLIFAYAVHYVPHAAGLMFTQGSRNGMVSFQPENAENLKYYTECVKDIGKGIAKTVDLYIKKQLRFEAV